MTEIERKRRVFCVFQSIARTYDAANDRISLWRHRKWKQFAVNSLRVNNSAGRALDVGCGTGDMLELLAGKYPQMQLVGLDFSPNMLEVASERLKGCKRVQLDCADAMEPPYGEKSFDCIVSAFALRNMPDWKRALERIVKLAKPGGVISCIDSFVPTCRLVLPVYRAYFRLVMPFLGGGLRKTEEYGWLCSSTEAFAAADEVISTLMNSGVKLEKRRSFMFGACVCIVGRKQMDGDDYA